MIYYANFSTSFLLPYDFFTPVLIYQESVDVGTSNHVIFTYNPFASNRSTLIYLVQRYSLLLMVVVTSQQRQPSLSFFQPQTHKPVKKHSEKLSQRSHIGQLLLSVIKKPKAHIKSLRAIKLLAP